MKYTHIEIEEDRRKPVGSLFLHLMDRDSMPVRVHRVASARARYDRSLPNTPFSRYADDKSGATDERAGSAVRGRRFFPHRDQPQFSIGMTATRRPETAPAGSSGRTTASPRRQMRRDNLGPGLIVSRAETNPTPVRHRRHIREPGDGHSTNFLVPTTRSSTSHTQGTDYDNHSNGNASAANANSPRRASTATRQHANNSYARRASADHLSLSTLVPRYEAPPERPMPEPMVKKPVRTGLRMYPERRSQSATHRGVKQVRPMPHWRSAADRQWDFLELGVAASEATSARHRNQSSVVGLGGGAPAATARRDPAAAGGAGSAPRQRWRSNSAAPPPRSFNIITGLPI